MSFNPSNLKSTLDFATAYIKNGFSIIPLHKKSKKPSIDKWDPFKVSYPSKEQLEEWFSHNGNNIGLVTGRISAIFVIDVDGKKAYEYYINKIQSDRQLISANEHTMKIKTGSGNINIVFGFNPQDFSPNELRNLVLWRETDDNNGKRIVDEQDNNNHDHNHSEIRLKGEGGYIVAPPSIHPNNNEYNLVNGIDPIILKREQIQKLIDLLSKDGFGRDKKSTNSISQIVEILKPHYSNGRRNDLVLYLSGWLRKLGIPLETAEKIITELAKDDEEKGTRIRTLHETYKKQDLNEIAGYSGLLKLLSYDCSEDDAKEKLTTVKEIIDKKFETNKNNKKEKEEEIDILSLIKEDYCIALFVDQFNKPYIAIKIKEHVEILGIDNQRFKNWLFKVFYKNTGDLSSEQVENVIKVLKSDAEFNENRKKLELRVAKAVMDDYTFYYDLTNSNWSTVKITSQGWSIENNPPILFRRYSNHLPQVIPMRVLEKNENEYNVLDKFVDLLNVKDEDNKLLLKCYVISLFIPGIAKPILMLHGEQGSAKSTLQELIKMLVDPSIVRTLTFPRDINELVQQLSHNYVAYFDNVSVIKEWISDTLCRGSTGSGFSKRQLYTDDDDIIYNFKRCIGINGINLGATKADLLDRGIIIQLERIPKERRRKLEDIWKEFESLRPQLLGYIFDILVKVLQIKQKSGITIPNGLNRMADFEEYAEIIARCMGYPEGEFLRVYQDNIDVQIDEAIQASPLSMAVVELMDNKEDNDAEWNGTATELYIKLNEIAEATLKINIQKIKFWPKSANHLSRRLTEVKTNLREKSIVIERYKDEKGYRKIKICKVSSISPYRQETQIQAQKPNKSLDDTLDDTNKVSSNKNDENQAQNNDFGRYDSIDDTLH
ncbi:MAG TPA: bifunctional DNA primase/polymerase, partial [Nitrososphaeraceae archaeon]|nr:bifunctional DNA primase/polymerase [Nitrososphaeraceae archaeon]